jgi:hypothetical protein
MGAQTRQVLFVILRETVVLAGVGVVVGLLDAAGLTRYVQSMLYGLKPTDPFTLGGTFLFGTNDRDGPAVNPSHVGCAINLRRSIVPNGDLVKWRRAIVHPPAR